MESSTNEVHALPAKKVDRPLRVPRPAPKVDATERTSKVPREDLDARALGDHGDDDIDELDDWAPAEKNDERPTLRVLTPARPPRMPDAPIPFYEPLRMVVPRLPEIVTPEVPAVQSKFSATTIPAPSFSTPTIPIPPIPGPPATPIPVSDISPMTLSVSGSAMRTLMGVGDPPGEGGACDEPAMNPGDAQIPSPLRPTGRGDSTVRSLVRVREGVGAAVSRVREGLDAAVSHVREGLHGAGAGEAPYPWLEPVFERWPALHRVQEGRPRLLLPALAGLGLLVWLFGAGIFIKGTIALATRSGSPDARTAAVDPGARGSIPAPVAAESATGAATGEPIAPPCTVTGQPKSIAAQAQLVSGVEAAPGLRGIGLGFARAPREAVTLLLDPAALTVDLVRAYNALDPVRRTTPVLSTVPAFRGPNTKADRITAAISTDSRDGAMEGRRTAFGPSPIDLGLAAGHLVWAHRDSLKTNALWALDGDSPVEALRAAPLEPAESGYAIAFRRGGAIWTGVLARASGDKGYLARGELLEIRGLGSQVGSPSIAVSGHAQMIVWADRASSDEAWSLRYRRMDTNLGQVPEPAKIFEVPSGGLGAPYMSPAVTSLGGGRFLVVWTEGPVSGHQVRAQTIGADGRPQGAPLTISAEGANAGQGQAAVLADGRGAVAYLVGTNGGFELVATSVVCPSSPAPTP
ncbi:hypothetical protein [Pendulispora albinea]|uniref:Uncharacterized protein n=1 Tax=Pendulispora albinea TaxID=2741071 RepID=A0ABZ2M3M7_9BACT